MRLPRLPLFHLSTLNYYASERKLLVVLLHEILTLLLSHQKTTSNYRRTGHFLCNETT